MHQSHIPQYTIQKRNVHISVLNDVLWDVGQVHCDIVRSDHSAAVSHFQLNFGQNVCIVFPKNLFDNAVYHISAISF